MRIRMCYGECIIGKLFIFVFLFVFVGVCGII